MQVPQGEVAGLESRTPQEIKVAWTHTSIRDPGHSSVRFQELPQIWLEKSLECQATRQPPWESQSHDDPSLLFMEKYRQIGCSPSLQANAWLPSGLSVNADWLVLGPGRAREK